MCPKGRPVDESVPQRIRAEGGEVNVPERPVVAEEQLRYARVLEWGARIGLLAAVLAFALYVAGVLPGRVPLEDLPALWSLPGRSDTRRSMVEHFAKRERRGRAFAPLAQLA